MDHNYIDQYDLVSQYLLGKLPPKESERFEEHFIDCPECVDRLKTTRNFLQDLRMVSARQALQTGRYNPELRRSFSQLLSHKPFALGAICVLIALIAGVTLTAYYMQHLLSDIDRAKSDSSRLQRSYEEQQQAAELSDKEHQEKEQESTEKLRNLQAELDNEREISRSMAAESGLRLQPGEDMRLFDLKSARRGTADANEIVNEIIPPRSSTGFVILIELEGEVKYDDYRITIRDNRKQLVFRRDGYRPNSFNSLSPWFYSNFFRPGDYSFLVEGIIKRNDISIIGNYPVRIVKSS